MFLELETPVEVGRGGGCLIGGGVSYSSTFSGAPELVFRLSGSSKVLGSASLEPGAEEWSLDVELPKLEPGSYIGWIDAVCNECGVETSLPVDLTVA